MNANPHHIEKCLLEIEEKLGWGNSRNWTHRDFLNLSEEILDVTGETLSYITLKRLWGKVSYHSLPQFSTLNILARFLGHESWRSYENSPQTEIVSREIVKSRTKLLTVGKQLKFILGTVVSLVLICLVLIILSAQDRPRIKFEDFDFTSQKVISNGIPNSVIFDIDARLSPFDSVIVQQTWDSRLQAKIPREQMQHTSIYYYPGFFEAKLIVGDEIVKEHPLHITTNNWYCAFQMNPTPVYIDPGNLLVKGMLEIQKKDAEEMNIALQPETPLLRIGYSADFGELKTDNFFFEAKLRQTYFEGNAACRNVAIYLLCEGQIIKIPLCAPGCVSSISLNFIDFYASGKNSDLSPFGVNFEKDVCLRIQSQQGIAQIFLNEELIYNIPSHVKPIEIKAIDFRFEGLGSLDRVRLGRNEFELVIDEDFERESQ